MPFLKGPPVTSASDNALRENPLGIPKIPYTNNSTIPMLSPSFQVKFLFMINKLYELVIFLFSLRRRL